MAQNAIITHIIVAMRVQEIWTLNRTYTATMVGKSFHILILPIDNLMINFNVVSRTIEAVLQTIFLNPLGKMILEIF